MPLFSVIIPTYNRADGLKKSLASLVAQTNKDFEVIICDDGSIDGTKEVVESYRNQLDLIYVWEENWGGPARPRNQGLKLARADWICFLDSDDWWYPDKLAECARHLAAVDIIYHDLDVYNDVSDRPLWLLRSRQLMADSFTDLMLNSNALFNSSVVVRKSVLAAVGGLSEDKKLIGLEDFDCWLKIAKINKRFLYLPQALGAYHLGDNISRAIRHAENLEALWRLHKDDLRSEREKKIVARTLKYNQARIYHINSHYGRAFRYYLKAGPLILISRIFRKR